MEQVKHQRSNNAENGLCQVDWDQHLFTCAKLLKLFSEIRLQTSEMLKRLKYAKFHCVNTRSFQGRKAALE